MSRITKRRRALIGLALAATSLLGAACIPEGTNLVDHSPTVQGRASILALRKVGHSTAGRTNTWCGPIVATSVGGGSGVRYDQMCESSVGGGLHVGRETTGPYVAWLGQGKTLIEVTNGNTLVCVGLVDYTTYNSAGERPVTCN